MWKALVKGSNDPRTRDFFFMQGIVITARQQSPVIEIETTISIRLLINDKQQFYLSFYKTKLD